MSARMPNISVSVDVTNPGQFFACCGLLELADRLWPGAEGWFEDSTFGIACRGNFLRRSCTNWLSQTFVVRLRAPSSADSRLCLSERKSCAFRD